jgi:hypothetical protein
MLLAKCVHDIDWLSHLIGRPARRVSSFGGLYHFRADQRPDDAADQCLDCVLQESCPYSAPKIYLPCLGDHGWERWPLRTVTSDLTVEGVLAALRDGPYGRCVYACDNDVVDHQVVSIEYEGGITASFTATAFTGYQFRRTKLFGTHGCIEGDGKVLDLLDFRTGRRERVPIPTVDVPKGLGASRRRRRRTHPRLLGCPGLRRPGRSPTGSASSARCAPPHVGRRTSSAHRLGGRPRRTSVNTVRPSSLVTRSERAVA